jgi:hypothetical protein
MLLVLHSLKPLGIRLENQQNLKVPATDAQILQLGCWFQLSDSYDPLNFVRIDFESIVPVLVRSELQLRICHKSQLVANIVPLAH